MYLFFDFFRAEVTFGDGVGPERIMGVQYRCSVGVLVLMGSKAC